MRIDKTTRMFVLALLVLSSFQAAAQTPAPTAQGTRKTTVSSRVNPVIVQNEEVAPQIVTILHRLTGLKVIRQLLHDNEELGAIASLDEDFGITREAHTNVIAGLALEDGDTVAAWLPDAAAEMPPSTLQFAPKRPIAPNTFTPPAPPQPQMPLMPARPLLPGGPIMTFESMVDSADLRVITRDGKRLAGRYVGIDGLTGLSVIALTNSGLPRIVEPKDENIVVGQRLRVIGPQPAPPEPGTLKSMYFRVGQTDATVSSLSRSSSGGLARIRVRAARLSPASMGSIAVNDAGETVGIIDAVQGTEASIVPVALVRSAVKRVITRQASVPRPWLGIRGEPIEAVSLEELQGGGWQLDQARELAEKRCGILLTSVIPGSPAAENKLKPGDVILSVDNEDIRNAEEFTLRLLEAGAGRSIQFVVARPGQAVTEAFQIELSESPDPLFGRRMALGDKLKPMLPGSLMAHGIEAIEIKPKVAMRFGATRGLLVVYVHPATDAFIAGLRPGDVIEAIDGQDLLSGSSGVLLKNPGERSTLKVVRNKQKLTITVSTARQ